MFVVLVRAGMKLIINRKKEYNQMDILKHNTEHKESQLKDLQMSAIEQIRKEVQSAVKLN